MTDLDLFGGNWPPPAASLRPLPEPVSVDLFACAAELAALTSDKPKSQEHAALFAPAAAVPMYFVLSRRLSNNHQPWRCVLITDDFAEAHTVSDRLARPLPRIAPRETAIVDASALSSSERERYTAQAAETDAASTQPRADA